MLCERCRLQMIQEQEATSAVQGLRRVEACCTEQYTATVAGPTFKKPFSCSKHFERLYAPLRRHPVRPSKTTNTRSGARYFVVGSWAQLP